MQPTQHLLPELPVGLEGLAELAANLRWTWNHAADALWNTIDPDIWQQTENPYVILQNVSSQRLASLAQDPDFCQQLHDLLTEQKNYLNRSGWYQSHCQGHCIQQVAYFSMEFGIGEALPFYAGGLGVLAGDFLKAASDLCMPVIGVGLLYHQGYFRQMLNASGWQQEAYPVCDTTNLPISPVYTESGEWLQVSIELPGRIVLIRVWQAHVGGVTLYLLDSNHPLNGVVDRSITSQLYGGGREIRLLQEVVLGVAGWRALMKLNLPIDICHMNEGHAAFVVLERTLDYMQKSGLDFYNAFWAIRAGNVFTTHTMVKAGFDVFEPELLEEYGVAYADTLGIPTEKILQLGRLHHKDSHEPFNMAYLAIRGSATVNGVSKLHGEVSRKIFSGLYPRWPSHEVPITYVTNGVHVPSWDSRWADDIWTQAAGKERWLGSLRYLSQAIEKQSNEQLWKFCSNERRDLVRYARKRFTLELGQRGADKTTINEALCVLDPNVLTLGFARRFTLYKRPNLLLQDAERLEKLLTHRERPVQLIIAGKAHPKDEQGKKLVQQWAQFIQRSAVKRRVVFLEDYDITLAQQLVQGVDIWINTPRRPWEACGTSGMKVLVNGGLNISVLDGWWAEAHNDHVGWAIGDGSNHSHYDDVDDAQQLYHLLEKEVIPEFYNRDVNGVPLHWVERMRVSMASLAPQFSCNRMVQEYVDNLYQPAAEHYQRRTKDNAKIAKLLAIWSNKIQTHWQEIHWGNVEVAETETGFVYKLQLYLGDLSPDLVQVQLYAETDKEENHQQKSNGYINGESGPHGITMDKTHTIAGATNGYIYSANVNTTRPYTDFTARVIPWHPDAYLPQEANQILWWDNEH
ncbi:alpha-glucan phosphorylase [Candidatus Endobugula sertula]|uniref:Alpha-glucan phosphorylase n=1 Tax=Candidatus Endobugula sertula TaxID=62101 RepID=A0A1D2QSE2_9GAMM|nr:alpha-glucan phosphorylase [Candidatus Endobugula sertula]